MEDHHTHGGQQRFRQTSLTTLTTFGFCSDKYESRAHHAKTLILMTIPIGFGRIFVIHDYLDFDFVFRCYIHQKKHSSERLIPKFQIQAKINTNIIESEIPKSDLKISF